MSASNLFFFPRGPLKVDEYNSNDTFIVPNGVNEIMVMGCGGGAGGGIDATSDSGTTFYSGGNGATLMMRTLSVTPGDSYTITIGAGGAPGAYGGDSTFSGPGGTLTMRAAEEGSGHYGVFAINGKAVPPAATSRPSVHDGTRGQHNNGFRGGVKGASNYGGGGAGPFGDGADGASPGTGASAAANTGAGGGAGFAGNGSGGSGKVLVIYAENEL